MFPNVVRHNTATHGPRRLYQISVMRTHTEAVVARSEATKQSRGSPATLDCFACGSQRRPGPRPFSAVTIRPSPYDAPHDASSSARLGITRTPTFQEAPGRE